MLDFVKSAYQKLRRDQNLSFGVLADKSVTYTVATLVAPLYLRKVQEVGQRVRTVGGPPRIENYGYMSIGDDTRISNHVVRVEFGTQSGGELIIGKNCQINYGVSIGAVKSVRMGDRVRLGPYVRIMDSDFHDIYDRGKPAVPKPVVIEDDVWIGQNAVILSGVRVGKFSVIATGAVVIKDVPDYSLVGGVPAKVLKQLDPAKCVPDTTG